MPHLKVAKAKEPLWKEWDSKANKSGLRHVIYEPDSKDEYTGEWQNNKKHGKGTYYWKKTKKLYDGDWKFDKRNGFGTLSLRVKDSGFVKQYAGGWKNDLRHGFGSNYYSDNEHYEGEWQCDMRNGWGRMYYADGSIYEGEWLDDKKSGNGLIRLANNNRYEGEWKLDKKNGKGTFYYLDKGQIFEGVWQEDIPKCGEMRDYCREDATDPTEFPLPEVTLADPRTVLKQTEESLNEL